MGFFEDYRGDASWGRLAASYCIVSAVLFFQAPFFMPHLATYCQSVGGSLLLTAGSLYLTSKGEQGMTSLAQSRITANITSIKALLGIKDTAVADTAKSSTDTPESSATAQ